MLAHTRFTSQARMRMSEIAVRRPIRVPPCLSRLRRGRRFGRKLAPLVLLPNSYTALKQFSDETYAGIDDGLKDELIGAISAVGSYIRAYFGITCFPVGHVVSSKAKAPMVESPPKTAGLESPVAPVPLLLSQFGSTTDLEFGAEVGVAPTAADSSPVLPVARRKESYRRKGINVRRRVRPDHVKTAPSATATASTPTLPATIRPEEPGKCDFRGFKIPRKRSSACSDVDSSDTGKSTTDAPSKSRPPGAESVESLEPPHNFESLAKEIREMRRDVSELKQRHGVRESGERREHHEVRHGWSSRGGGRPCYPEGQSRGRRDRGAVDQRWSRWKEDNGGGRWKLEK